VQFRTKALSALAANADAASMATAVATTFVVKALIVCVSFRSNFQCF